MATGSRGGPGPSKPQKTPPHIQAIVNAATPPRPRADVERPHLPPPSLQELAGANPRLAAHVRAQGSGGIGDTLHTIRRAVAIGTGIDPKVAAEGLYSWRHPIRNYQEAQHQTTPVIGVVPFGGRPSGGLFAPKPRDSYVPRTLKVGDLEQQLPRARSPVAQVGERGADKASELLQQSERAKATPVVRLATAQERVAKAAGRSQRIERGRATAAVAHHLNAIKAVKEGSPEDVANFWYAQLPKTHRNATGLSLVRAQQAQELQYITSGKALADLGRRENAVRTEMGQADDATRLKLLRELEEIKLLKTDLPQRVQDASASIAQLDRVIAEPPPVNEAAIEAVHALGNERQRILVEGGRLNPHQAEARKGLVARAVGLEPTGEEAYVGHRLPQPESFRGSFMPSGGTGRVRSPKGVGSENKLVLAKTGRLRPSLRVAAEDYQSSQAFHQANVARNDLAKLGSQFTGHVPEGHVLVNPKGRTVPANWKTDELAQFGDGYEDIPAIREKAKEIVDGFIAGDREGFDRMKQQALEQGVSWDELRVLPKRLVDRYYSQFRPMRGRGGALKHYDQAIDAVATSIVFARLGYIPKNFAQNLIMAVPHQGPLLLTNAVRAAQAMADPELRRFLQAEVGHTGATGSLGAQTATQKLGNAFGFTGKVADDPVRISAFMHEAAAAGVIRRVGLLGARDRQALLRLFTDKSQRPLLNDIRSRAVEAMADFSRLTPDQARMARRFLVIPGWLMAGTRYPFHFAATHPVRSALLAYIALGEPGAPHGFQFNKPVNEYFKGSNYKQGIQIGGKRLRTNSLSPVSTPWELGQATVGTIRGKKNDFDFKTPTVFDEAQPLASSLIGFAQGGGVKSFERLGPGAKFLYDEATGTGNTAVYPEDKTRLGRLKRELGVIPIEVNDQPSAQRKYDKDLAQARDFARKYIPGGKLPPQVAEDLKWRLELDKAVGGEHDPAKKAEAAAKVFVRRYPQAKPQVEAALRDATSGSAARQKYTAASFYDELRSELLTDLSQFDSEMNDALKEEAVAK